MPTTKFGGLSGPFQAREVIASRRVPSDPDSRPSLLSPALASESKAQLKPDALESRVAVQGPPREAILTSGWSRSEHPYRLSSWQLEPIQSLPRPTLAQACTSLWDMLLVLGQSP